MLFASTPDNAQSQGKNCHPQKIFFTFFCGVFGTSFFVRKGGK
jgi:hypothetical protein